MSWHSENGEHEGWVARILEDGRQSHGSTGHRRDDGGLDFLELVPVDGDQDVQERVSSDRVHWWAARCNCGWRGSIWERVTEQQMASDATRRAWRPLGDVAEEPQHVEAAAHEEWQRHLEPREAAAAVSHAAAATTAHQQRLNAAVRDARQCGLSWAAIGHAAGISRQAAHERWGRLADGSDVRGIGREDERVNNLPLSVSVKLIKNADAALLRVLKSSMSSSPFPADAAVDAAVDALTLAGLSGVATWLRTGSAA